MNSNFPSCFSKSYDKWNHIKQWKTQFQEWEHLENPRNRFQLFSFSICSLSLLLLFLLCVCISYIWRLSNVRGLYIRSFFSFPFFPTWILLSFSVLFPSREYTFRNTFLIFLVIIMWDTMANTNVQGQRSKKKIFFPRDETDDFDPSVRLSEVLKLHHEKTLRTYIFFSLSYFCCFVSSCCSLWDLGVYNAKLVSKNLRIGCFSCMNNFSCIHKK